MMAASSLCASHSTSAADITALRPPFGMFRYTSYAFMLKFMLLITGISTAKLFPLLMLLLMLREKKGLAYLTDHAVRGAFSASILPTGRV